MDKDKKVSLFDVIILISLTFGSYNMADYHFTIWQTTVLHSLIRLSVDVHLVTIALVIVSTRIFNKLHGSPPITLPKALFFLLYWVIMHL
jgi:hypothetical protein